jgi:tRNA A58 N-methylase Trm61
VHRVFGPVGALSAGVDVADVGCGSGKALNTLAQAFPASRYVGYDNHAPSVEAARAAAEQAGVADRVRFEHRDVAAAGLPAAYDVVFTFDVVHDAGFTSLRTLPLDNPFNNVYEATP